MDLPVDRDRPKDVNAPTRCAIYARFSSDLQRPTSIEDQVRRCREFAEKQGWVVVDDFVRFDEAKSAATLAGREALHSLLASVKLNPAPFDCLLVDDTSRLARYLPDVLSMNDRLRYCGDLYLRCRPTSGLSGQNLPPIVDSTWNDG